MAKPAEIMLAQGRDTEDTGLAAHDVWERNWKAAMLIYARDPGCKPSVEISLMRYGHKMREREGWPSATKKNMGHMVAIAVKDAWLGGNNQFPRLTDTDKARMMFVDKSVYSRLYRKRIEQLHDVLMDWANSARGQMNRQTHE